MKNMVKLIGIIALTAIIIISMTGCPTETDPGTKGDTTAPVLSSEGVSVTRTSDTEATIGFTSSEAGTAYYLVVEKDAAAPTGAQVKAANNSFAATSGANSGKTVTLTAGAKDIYVVVQDAAGNLSAPLKIAAEAYSGGSHDPDCECDGDGADCDCGVECGCDPCAPGTPGKTLTGITAVYKSDNLIFPDTELDTLKPGLTVTAQYNDESSETLEPEDYDLSAELVAGELPIGENVTITVSYKGHTAGFTVTVQGPHTHNWTEDSWEVETPADCETDGIETRSCTATPPHSEERIITKLGHDYQSYETTLDPTCTVKGTKTGTCANDGTHTDSIDIDIDPDAHNWNNSYSITTPPTCTETGIETDTCSYNPSSHTRERDVAVNPDAHDDGAWHITTPATCTEEGTQELRCTRDSVILETETIPIDDDAHGWGNWSEITLKAGVEKKDCAHCGEEETRIVVDMASVPGGSFEMGTVSGGWDDERPVHTVTLAGFHMGRYEVTQAQWLEVMGYLPDDITSKDGMGDNYPVYFVSWHDAVEFCNKLSEIEGLTPYYTIDKTVNSDPNNTDTGYDPYHWLVTCDASAAGYRLPTEAQWEYAAKGGDPTVDGWVGYTYAGSDNPNEVAVYGSYGELGVTMPVGTKAANGLGTYDMSGNVMEWCWDWYDAYTSAPQTDPTGASSGSFRVIRGGSWYAGADQIRSVNRLPGAAGSSSYLVGFRVVRPAN